MPYKMISEIILLSHLRMERKKIGIFFFSLFLKNTPDLGPKLKTLNSLVMRHKILIQIIC